MVSCHTADSKPVKQEVNGTVILPPLVFPAKGYVTTVKRFIKVVQEVPMPPSDNKIVNRESFCV